MARHYLMAKVTEGGWNYLLKCLEKVNQEK
jgi:hypothetical protein